MSMKTILVPMEYHDAMQSALETALLLGRRSRSLIGRQSSPRHSVAGSNAGYGNHGTR
jgi:hypothetical protein